MVTATFDRLLASNKINMVLIGDVSYYYTAIPAYPIFPILINSSYAAPVTLTFGDKTIILDSSFPNDTAYGKVKVDTTDPNITADRLVEVLKGMFFTGGWLVTKQSLGGGVYKVTLSNPIYPQDTTVDNYNSSAASGFGSFNNPSQGSDGNPRQNLVSAFKVYLPLGTTIPNDVPIFVPFYQPSIDYRVDIYPYIKGLVDDDFGLLGYSGFMSQDVLDMWVNGQNIVDYYLRLGTAERIDCSETQIYLPLKTTVRSIMRRTTIQELNHDNILLNASLTNECIETSDTAPSKFWFSISNDFLSASDTLFAYVEVLLEDGSTAAYPHVYPSNTFNFDNALILGYNVSPVVQSTNVGGAKIKSLKVTVGKIPTAQISGVNWTTLPDFVRIGSSIFKFNKFCDENGKVLVYANKFGLLESCTVESIKLNTIDVVNSVASKEYSNYSFTSVLTDNNFEYQTQVPLNEFEQFKFTPQTEYEQVFLLEGNSSNFKDIVSADWLFLKGFEDNIEEVENLYQQIELAENSFETPKTSKFVIKVRKVLNKNSFNNANS